LRTEVKRITHELEDSYHKMRGKLFRGSSKISKKEITRMTIAMRV
jgi:hypothetical protein